MIVYGYARYSTDNQTDNSIEQQKFEIEKYCKENNCTMINFYHDSAISGKKDNRDSFQQMINDCIVKKEIDAILIWKFDRFARNRYDSALYKKKLKDKNIKVISITQKIDDSPESIILEGMIEMMDEYYCANVSANVKRKLNQNANDALFNGGTPPLGYDIVDKKYVVNKDEAVIIKDIFDLYLKGFGLVQMTSILNSKGYRNKKGTQFKNTSLYDIIGNERYTGVYLYNSKVRGSRKQKRDDIVRKEDAIPAIITKEIYKMAMEKRKSNAEVCGKFKSKEDYLLTGLIKCGICGNNYIGHTSKKTVKGKEYKESWYTCSSRNCNSKKCTNVNVKRNKLESESLKNIRKIIIDSEEIDNLVVKLNEEYLKAYESSISTIIESKNQLSKIDEKISNYILAIGNGVYSEKLKNELLIAEEEKAFLQNKISGLEKLKEIKILDKNFVLKAIKKDFKGFSTKSIEDQKELINKWVKEIKITPDRAEVTFTVFNKVSDLDMVLLRRIERPTNSLGNYCSIH